VIIDPDAPLDLDNSLVVADRLAEVVAGSGQPSAVVATGGETAKAWLRQVGASALTVHRELAPGVVLSSTDVPGTPVLVSKAGAFGGPDTLADALRLLRQRTGLAVASG
jgi:4-hydroxythreonine-4-phosphate dehydrogenase